MENVSRFWGDIETGIATSAYGCGPRRRNGSLECMKMNCVHINIW
jgi:hypothetical protein